MRTVVEEYQVMTFDELTEDQQEKAIEKHADINVDHDWWDGDYHLELSADEMKSRHIKLSENWQTSEKRKDSRGNIIGDSAVEREYPAYTGLFSYDSISLDLDRNWYIQFEDLTVNCEVTFRKFLRIPQRLWETCVWSFQTGRASNSDTRLVIEPNYYSRYEFTPRQQAIVDRAMGIMNDKINEALSGLQKSYDDLTSEKAIIETLKANEYEFTTDGSIA